MLMINRAVFLDLDGVLIKASCGKYNNKLSDVELIQSAIDAVALINDLGYKTFIITNQSGIAKGLKTIADHNEIINYVMHEVKKSGGLITHVYCCPHAPGDKNCDCRKPLPGNILKCAKEYDIDLSTSLFVGDMESDIGAAHNAGIRSVMVLSGLTLKTTVIKDMKFIPDFVFDDLMNLAEYLKETKMKSLVR